MAEAGQRSKAKQTTAPDLVMRMERECEHIQVRERESESKRERREERDGKK